METKLIRVNGNYNGITLESGKILFKDIAMAIIDGQNVTVDFANQEYLTSVFLNASIGYLYAFFKTDIINEKLTVSIEGSQLSGFNLIDRVLKNSEKYWNDNNFHDAVDIAIAKLSEGIL